MDLFQIVKIIEILYLHKKIAANLCFNFLLILTVCISHFTTQEIEFRVFVGLCSCSSQ